MKQEVHILFNGGVELVTVHEAELTVSTVGGSLIVNTPDEILHDYKLDRIKSYCVSSLPRG